MTANVKTMMFSGETPWHGLGTKLDNPATSVEAIKAAGLEWEVKKETMYLFGNAPIPNHYAVVRQDDRSILGVVGSKYTPLQNKDAFSFFDAIVGVKEAMYHTAGCLGEGEKVWILAKLPGYIRTTKDDVTEKYLLLSNSHDGTSTVKILFTPIRVVCQNTLNIALAGKEERISLKHTAFLGNRVNDVQKFLGIVNTRFNLMEQASQQLVNVKVDLNQFKNYVKAIGLVDDDPSTEKGSTQAENLMDDLSVLFENGKGTELSGVKGTAWSAFNAVVEYVDHSEPKRQTETLSKRADKILFGTGAILKQKAWDEALLIK